MQNHKTKLDLTIKAAAAAFMVFSFCGCFSRPSNSFQKKQHVQLMVSYSLVQMPGPTLTELPDTIQYYYYDDFVAVGLPVRRSIENGDKILEQNIFHSWFVFEKDSTYGYLFDSLGASNSRRLKIDSLLFARAYAARFDLSRDTLVAGIIDNNSGILLEKYVPKSNYGENYFDSAFYYYSPEMKNVRYSLSTYLDSLKLQKLFKVRILYNERYSASYGTNIPKREFSFEIRELPFKNFGIEGLIAKLKEAEKKQKIGLIGK